MHIVFVIHKRSASKNIFEYLFSKTELILQLKCKPSHPLGVNQLESHILADGLYLIESLDVDAFVQRKKSSSDVFCITEANIGDFDSILNYFDLVVRQGNNTSILLWTFKFFVLFKINSVSTFSVICNRVALSGDVNVLRVIFCAMCCMNFHDNPDVSTLNYINSFVDDFIFSPGFYLSLRRYFDDAEGNVPFLKRCFAHSSLIDNMINQDHTTSNIKEKCKLFLQVHLPTLLPRLIAPQNGVIQALLDGDYLYQQCINDALFTSLHHNLKDNNSLLFAELMENPNFLSVFFSINEQDDSVFHRWANHRLGHDLLMQSFDNIEFCLQFIQHPGFWEAFDRIYNEGAIYSSALHGICNQVDLVILKKIIFLLPTDSIPVVHKNKVFLASITPFNMDLPRQSMSSVISILKKKQGKAFEPIINRFRTLFMPPYFNQPHFWEQLHDEAIVPVVRKKNTDRGSLLSGNILFEKSKDKSTCNILLGELEKNSSKLFNELIAEDGFFNVFLQHHQQGYIDGSHWSESILYYWLKWRFMVPYVLKILEKEDISDRMIKHPSFWIVLISLSPKDNCSALHLLFQNKLNTILVKIKMHFSLAIQHEASALVSLLLHPTKDKESHPSCLLIDIAKYDEDVNTLITELFDTANQDALFAVLAKQEIDVSRFDLVYYLNRLIILYPGNKFFVELLKRCHHQLLQKLTQDKPTLRTLFDSSKANRKALDQAFLTLSFRKAWIECPLSDQNIDDILEIVYQTMFCGRQPQHAVLNAILSHPHPQINIKLRATMYKPLLDWWVGQSEVVSVQEEAQPIIYSLIKPMSVPNKSIPHPQGTRKQQVYANRLRKGIRVSDKSVVDDSLAGNVESQPVPPCSRLVRKTKAHFATPLSPNGGAVLLSSLPDDPKLAIEHAASLLRDLAMNVQNKKMIDTDDSQRALYEEVWLMSKEKVDLVYAIFEEKCFQSSCLADTRKIKDYYQQARLLLLISLIRNHIDIKELVSRHPDELLLVDDKTLPWLVQSLIYALGNYYRDVDVPFDTYVKPLFMKYISLSQDDNFLRGLLATIIQQKVLSDMPLATVRQAEVLIEERTTDLAQLKIYYLYLQFGVLFDLSLHSNLLPIIIFFSEEKIEETFKTTHTIARKINALYKNRLLSKYPHIERWIKDLFLIDNLLIFCQKHNLGFAEFMTSRLLLFGATDQYIQDKIRDYERKMKVTTAKLATVTTPRRYLGHELMNLVVDFEGDVAQIGVLISQVPVDNFFKYSKDVLHFINSMIASKSAYFPCVVGSKARHAAISQTLFNPEGDLDFDVLQADLAFDELINIDQLKRKAEEWLLSFSADCNYTSLPKQFKHDFNHETKTAWCSFKAEIAHIKLDFRFLFSTMNLERLISFSRSERVLNWSSYFWELKSLRMFSPQLQEKLGLAKPAAELTFNNMSYVFRTVFCQQKIPLTTHLTRVLVAALIQYKTDSAFKEVIDNSFIAQFKSKLGDLPQRVLGEAMHTVFNRFFPLSQHDTFFSVRASKAPSPLSMPRTAHAGEVVASFCLVQKQ